MKRQYDEIMEKIEVTDEMRARILSHLQAVDIQQKPHSKIVVFPAVKRYLSVAACLAILLTGTFALSRLWNREPPNEVAAVPNIVEAKSIEELSKLVGFDVTDIAELPFETEKVTYTAYWSLAEIEYQGDGQSATFHKSVGDTDNSGDYTVYDKADEIQIGGITVTLKGNGGTYTLAIWSDGEYAYSLNMTVGLTAEKWSELILSVAD